MRTPFALDIRIEEATCILKRPPIIQSASSECSFSSRSVRPLVHMSSPSYPSAVYCVVRNVVLVSTMFALRLVPRGVEKKGIISEKRGIPRYVPCKQVPRYMPRMCHVMCHVCAPQCPCIHLYWALISNCNFAPPRRRRRRLPPPAPFVPPLRLFFTGEWRLFAQKIFKIFTVQ